MTLTETFSCEEVADYFDVHINTVRKWIRDGNLNAVDTGRNYRIREEDLEQFIEERQTANEGA